MSLDEINKDGNTVIESNGIKVAYPIEAEKRLRNVTIDYRNKWYNKGFRVKKPLFDFL